MNLKERFLSALRDLLSDEEVNDYGEGLFLSLMSYLLGAVRERTAEVYSGFEFHKDKSGQTVAEREFDLDAGVLIQSMKVINPEIKERPLDVVLIDRKVREVLLAMMVKIITVLNSQIDVYSEVYAAPYVGNYRYVDPKLQALGPLSFSISFYIKPKVNDVLLDQNQRDVSSLRKRVIRLAYTRDDLRANLLPLILR